MFAGLQEARKLPVAITGPRVSEGREISKIVWQQLHGIDML